MMHHGASPPPARLCGISRPRPAAKKAFPSRNGGKILTAVGTHSFASWDTNTAARQLFRREGKSSAKIRLGIFVHPIRRQQIALGPPTEVAVLKVGLQKPGIADLQLVAERDVMGAEGRVAEAVVVVDVLVGADETCVRNRGVEVRLAFENALESISKPLVFQDDAAGDEISVLGRRVVAQPEQNLPPRIADDEVDGDQRCKRHRIRLSRRAGGRGAALSGRCLVPENVLAKTPEAA